MNAQNSILGFEVSTSLNDYFSFSKILGGGSYEGKYSYSLGISYQYKFNSASSMVTGLNYSSNHFSFFSADHPQIPLLQNTRVIDLIRVPIIYRFSFARYFFIDTGFLLSFDCNRSLSIRHDGVGYMLGSGIQFGVNGFSFSIGPMAGLHTVIPFYDQPFTYHILEAGIKLSTGYIF
jgi:hypothetical protein